MELFQELPFGKLIKLNFVLKRMVWPFSRRQRAAVLQERETVPIVREEIMQNTGSPYRSVPILQRRIVESGVVFGKTGLLGSDPIEESLEKCVRSCYRPLFMPELAAQRLLQGKESSIWNFYHTLSLMATGRTKAGNEVVVFTHTDHYLCNPQEMRKSMEEENFKKGQFEIPQERFEELLDQEDNGKVFVVDHHRLKDAPYGNLSLDSVLNERHPLLQPFFGLPEEKTVQYLRTFAASSYTTGFCFCDDLEPTPKGRLLFLDSGYGRSVGPCNSRLLNRRACFVGVKERSEQLAPRAHQG